MMECGCRVHTVGMGGWIDLCERHTVIEQARKVEADRQLTAQADAARRALDGK